VTRGGEKTQERRKQGTRAAAGPGNDSVGRWRRLAENLADNPICAVTVDASIPCIVLVWKRYATSAQLRFIQESALRLLRENALHKILGDDTALPTIHGDDRSWIAENWMPRAIAAGLRAVASKSPLAHFGRVSVDAVLSVAPAPLIWRSFDDMAAARRWLKSVAP